jgi:hypothetical protein
MQQGGSLVFRVFLVHFRSRRQVAAQPEARFGILTFRRLRGIHTHQEMWQ